MFSNFDSDSFLNLEQIAHDELSWLRPMLHDDERPIISLRNAKDGVAFTNIRVILSAELGVAGVKRALATIPYESITSYFIETPGPFDLSVILRIFVREAGELKLELIRNTKVKSLDGLLSRAICSRAS